MLSSRRRTPSRSHGSCGWLPITVSGRPAGAGSNLCAGTVPLAGGIVLSTARMNRILEVAPEEMLARAEPGCPRWRSTTLRRRMACSTRRIRQPHRLTIGATSHCAGGLRGLKYGVTRNYVLADGGAATGEIVRTGGRLWKDVAGYDLTG